MAKRKPMTAARRAAIAAYSKERTRIRNKVRTLEKAGYTFQDNLVPVSVKEIKGLTTNEIKRLTKEASYWQPFRLERKATKQVESTGEKFTITAEEHIERSPKRLAKIAKQRKMKREARQEMLRLQIERKKQELAALQKQAAEAASAPSKPTSAKPVVDDAFGSADFVQDMQASKKKAEEKLAASHYKLNSQDKDFLSHHQGVNPDKLPQEVIDLYEEAYVKINDWETGKKAEDAFWKALARTTPQYRERFDQGELHLEGLYDMIADVGVSNWRTSKHLKKFLDDQIEKQGREQVIENISKAPEQLVEEAQVAIMYHEGTGQHDAAFIRIYEIITGGKMNVQELRDLEDAMEQDAIDDISMY